MNYTEENKANNTTTDSEWTLMLNISEKYLDQVLQICSNNLIKYIQKLKKNMLQQSINRKPHRKIRMKEPIEFN